MLMIGDHHTDLVAGIDADVHTGFVSYGFGHTDNLKPTKYFTIFRSSGVLSPVMKSYLSELFSSIQGEGPYVEERQLFMQFCGVIVIAYIAIRIRNERSRFGRADAGEQCV